jgi:GNAT superfamily N-acetyltransferase
MENPASDIVIRVAAPGEAAVITAQRRAMFAEMRPGPAAQLDAMAAAFETWVAERLARGNYRGWLAVTPAGQVVGGAGVWVMDWPPHMLHTEPRRANILNVYVEPAYRRRGLARALTETALAWCRQQQIALVILHASEAGRAIYTALGFKPTNEMSLALANASDTQTGR